LAQPWPAGSHSLAWPHVYVAMAVTFRRSAGWLNKQPPILAATACPWSPFEFRSADHGSSKQPCMDGFEQLELSEAEEGELLEETGSPFQDTQPPAAELAQVGRA